MNNKFVKYSTDRVHFVPLKTHIGMVGTRFFTPEIDVKTLQNEFGLNMDNHPKLYSCGKYEEKKHKPTKHIAPKVITVKKQNVRKTSKHSNNLFMFG